MLECRSPSPMAAVLLAERTRIGAPGLEGGEAVLTVGDKLLVRTPGAGGWGDPRERSEAARERDRLHGMDEAASK